LVKKDSVWLFQDAILSGEKAIWLKKIAFGCFKMLFCQVKRLFRRKNSKKKDILDKTKTPSRFQKPAGCE
jgi:hypothetical protein